MPAQPAERDRDPGVSREPDPRDMTRAELFDFLRSRHTSSLWPFAGRALGISRSLTYQLAGTETIRVLRLGHRYRVPCAWPEDALFRQAKL